LFAIIYEKYRYNNFLYTKMKPCAPDQIRNPATGRCVSRTGAIGRKILSGRATAHHRTGAQKPCPPDQIRNPATGRCVSRTGAIGRKILGANAGRAEEEARKSKAEEEARKRKDEEEARKRKAEEEARKRKDEEEARKRKAEEEARKRKDEEEARKRKDEEEARKRKAKNKDEDYPNEQPCEADNHDPATLPCVRKNALKLHPDKNPNCPVQSKRKFEKWMQRCEKEF
jgi:septin family protein